MPIRKIPKNYLCVTGGFASQKTGRMMSFESLLEKEYMLLLDFDDTVATFEEQPVNIPLTGIPRGYTPDLLVRFHIPCDSEQVRPPLLVEVKHTSDLARHAEKYAPKFAAAQSYALQMGWEFAIKTEHDIRTQRLANLKFLRTYRNLEVPEADCATILHVVARHNDGIFFHNLLAEIAEGEMQRLHWMPIIWHMVINQRLFANLDAALDNDFLLHSPEIVR